MRGRECPITACRLQFREVPKVTETRELGLGRRATVSFPTETGALSMLSDTGERPEKRRIRADVLCRCVMPFEVRFPRMLQNHLWNKVTTRSGGERGIRTPDTLPPVIFSYFLTN